MVTIATEAESTPTGDPLQFQIRADPPPAADLTVGVTIDVDGCTLDQAPESVTIAAGDLDATLAVRITDVEVGRSGCVVTATIEAGAGYELGDDGATASSTRSVTVTVNVAPGTRTPVPDVAIGRPDVSIDRLVSSVTEGELLRFRLTADPAPTAPITVNLRWDDPGRRLSGSPPRRVTIPTSGTVTFTAATIDDDIDLNGPAQEEFHFTEVTVTVVAGSGYEPLHWRAGIIVLDNDQLILPWVSIVAVQRTVTEGDVVMFRLTASPPPTSPLTVNLVWIGFWKAGSPRLVPTTLPKTARIPTSGTLTLPFGTIDDIIDNPGDGFLAVHLTDGRNYLVDEPASATVSVLDDEG